MESKAPPPSRRSFLGAIAATATTLGFTSLTTPLKAAEKKVHEKFQDPGHPDELFKNIKGKHRVVFDATQPHGVYPFAWPRVFLLTNVATGTPEKDNNVIVVLRHNAIPYAFEERLWSKYNFSEVFKANHPLTNVAIKSNPFWQPAPGTFTIPGIGPVAIGINELQESGVLFLVCDAAITVYSSAVSRSMGMNADEVKKEWISALLPNIHRVPSGVWALGRAQEKGCAYIFAG